MSEMAEVDNRMLEEQEKVLYLKNTLFLAPTGALEEGILYVRPDFPQKNTANEFLKHSKESRGVLGKACK